MSKVHKIFLKYSVSISIHAYTCAINSYMSAEEMVGKYIKLLYRRIGTLEKLFTVKYPKKKEKKILVLLPINI